MNPELRHGTLSLGRGRDREHSAPPDILGTINDKYIPVSYADKKNTSNSIKIRPPLNYQISSFPKAPD